jgi:hypothetical protein
MSSIRDYPDAQCILAKHGRKRLALGSKAAEGPRDETTSGTQSDSEIEITRPDTEASSSRSLHQQSEILENDANYSVKRDGKPLHTKIYIKDTNESIEIEPKKEEIENSSIKTYLTSPQSALLDTPHHRSLSMINLKHFSASSQENVIGPTSSFKSLNKRLLKKSSSCNVLRRSVKNKSNSLSSKYSDDEINYKTLSKRYIKPKPKNYMRRSNSEKRGTRRTSHRNKRCVLSDGENESYRYNIKLNRQNSQSSISEHSDYKVLKKRHLGESREVTTDEELFLRSMKQLYLETTKHYKRRTVSF